MNFDTIMNNLYQNFLLMYLEFMTIFKNSLIFYRFYIGDHIRKFEKLIDNKDFISEM